jgi:tRNA threonylcarbamoyladenosine biosynthesis protein TsaE
MCESKRTTAGRTAASRVNRLSHRGPVTTIRNVTHLSRSPAQTQKIAADFARSLKGGECIALEGDLGAGKTQFVRGLVRGLGGEPRSVSSPTFMLLNVYNTGRVTVYHLDAYRVQGADDFEGIGFLELLEQGGVVIVEWASRVSELLPKDHVAVRIEPTGPRERRIEMGRET